MTLSTVAVLRPGDWVLYDGSAVDVDPRARAASARRMRRLPPSGSRPPASHGAATNGIRAAISRRSSQENAATGSSPTTWRRPCGYPAAQPRTGPPTTASGSVCSTACNATAPARCASIRDAAIVRRDPAGNSARAWVFRKTIVDSFVCNPATAVKLATLKEFGATGSNKALLQADPTAPTSRVLGGVPLLTSPSIGDDVVWAVARNRAVIALRSGTEVTTDNSVYFTSRRVGVRAVLRIGWAFTDVAAVSKIAITP